MSVIAIQTNIAGVKFRDIEAQVRANRLKPGEPLTLVPEPDNKFDEFAVKVYDSDATFLGYVPRVFSQSVAKALADGHTLRAWASGEDLEINIESVPQDADEPQQ